MADLSDELAAALADELADELVSAALFGSRARGDAGPWSDWDLLVVVRSEPADSLALAVRLRRACAARTGTSPTCLLRSRHAFEGSFPAVYLDIAVDARVLAGHDYLEPRLARIRQLAEAAGLRRVRWGEGFVWEWERPPRGPWIFDWSGYRDVA